MFLYSALRLFLFVRQVGLAENF